MDVSMIETKVGIGEKKKGAQQLSVLIPRALGWEYCIPKFSANYEFLYITKSSKRNRHLSMKLLNGGRDDSEFMRGLKVTHHIKGYRPGVFPEEVVRAVRTTAIYSDNNLKITIPPSLFKGFMVPCEKPPEKPVPKPINGQDRDGLAGDVNIKRWLDTRNEEIENVLRPAGYTICAEDGRLVARTVSTIR